jgi:hypothetical protein
MKAMNASTSVTITRQSGYRFFGGFFAQYAGFAQR